MENAYKIGESVLELSDQIWVKLERFESDSKASFAVLTLHKGSDVLEQQTVASRNDFVAETIGVWTELSSIEDDYNLIPTSWISNVIGEWPNE